MYFIIRKHSSDSQPHIVDTVETKAEARKYIKGAVDELIRSFSTPHSISTLGDVVNVRFIGPKEQWSIGYWFEKVNE
jgi:hypothetical protein